MKRIIKKLLTVALGCLALAAVAAAQNSKKPSTLAASYVITAKAGGVNLVVGNVTVLHADGKSAMLEKGRQLESGDQVKSSSDGRAEILLNPGSVVRVAENSDVTFVSNSLDDLQVRVNRGTAIFEVVAADDFTVAVTTPKSDFTIIKSGIYRADVAADGTAKIEVWKGKALLNNAVAIKAGQTSSLDAGQIAVVKFNRDDKDAFELWSKDRAKELAKINDQLISRQVNRSLLAFSRNSGWYDGFGVWVQDPFSRSYCFFPYAYGYSSPYGYGYNQSVWTSPAYGGYNNQNNGYNPLNNSNSGNNSGNNSAAPPAYNPPAAPPSVEPSRPQMERPSIVERKIESGRID